MAYWKSGRGPAIGYDKYASDIGEDVGAGLCGDGDDWPLGYIIESRSSNGNALLTGTRRDDVTQWRLGDDTQTSGGGDDSGFRGFSTSAEGPLVSDSNGRSRPPASPAGQQYLLDPGLPPAQASSSAEGSSFLATQSALRVELGPGDDQPQSYVTPRPSQYPTVFLGHTYQASTLDPDTLFFTIAPIQILQFDGTYDAVSVPNGALNFNLGFTYPDTPGRLRFTIHLSVDPAYGHDGVSGAPRYWNVWESGTVNAVDYYAYGGQYTLSIFPGYLAFEYWGNVPIEFHFTVTQTWSGYLFTNNQDVINFNALTPEQIASIGPETIIDFAGDGDDIIQMPNLNAEGLRSLLLPTGMDAFAQSMDGGGGNDTLTAGNTGSGLHGGSGDDTLIGGAGNDGLYGGAGNDLLFGSIGQDWISGGAGDDIIDFVTANIASNSYELVQRLFGENTELSAAAGYDTLLLPGSADSYTVSTRYLSTTWQTSDFLIQGANSSSYRLELREIERVIFSHPFDNVEARSVYNLASLTAAAAYGFGGEYAYPLIKLSGTNLRGVSFLEVGMFPSSFGGKESSIDYTFSRQGVYEARYSFSLPGVLGLPGLSISGTQRAIITAGVIGGENTLVVSFEGTNISEIAAEVLSYDAGFFTEAWKQFEPLVAGIIRFVNFETSGVSRVMVTGHSLGAALTQRMVATLNDANIDTIGVGFANPGVFGVGSVENLTSVQHAGDWIAGITNSVSGGIIVVDRPDLPLWQHGMADYAETMSRLQRYAVDINSNPSLSDAPFAAALRSGTAFDGRVNITLGSDGYDHIVVDRGQDYVLAGPSPDSIVLFMSDDVLSGPPVVVDGGAGDDVLLFYSDAAEAITYRWNDGEVLASAASRGAESDVVIARTFDVQWVIANGQLLDRGVAVAEQNGDGSAFFTVSNTAGRFTVSSSGDGQQTIQGTYQDDVIFLGAGGKTVRGGPGQDIIIRVDISALAAFGQAAVVAGPSGIVRSQSFIDGGGGIDIMAGGDTDTTYVVDDSRDVVIELEDGGYDTVLSSVDYSLSSFVEALTLQGQAGLRGVGNQLANMIVGGAGSDFLDGFAGNDTIQGGLGRDNISGGEGDDFLAGGEGDDILDGGAGSDAVMFSSALAAVTVHLWNGSVSGGDGNDTLIGIENVYGSAYADVIDGADDIANMLAGREGDDQLDGRSGDDRLFGEAGNDVLIGGAGDDSLIGGGGSDKVFGGTGDDVIHSDLGGDWLEGGDGFDTVIFYSAVTVRLWNGTAVGVPGSDTLSGIENIIGSWYNDSLIGADGVSNVLQGSRGDDYLNGLSGDDLLQGGLGNDTLDGGAGNDTADYTDAASAVTVRLFAGTATGGAGSDTLANIENAVGSAFVDSLIGSNGIDNRLEGREGNDYLNGLTGDDHLLGGAGNDLLEGGLGADTLDGGDGIDVAYYLNSTAAVTVRLWNQTTAGAAGNDVFVSIENITGSNYSDALVGAEGVGNVLSGEAGNDFINGLGGDDVLIGGTGNDTLWGGTGNDVLDGGLGNDTLDGGAGVDTATYLSATAGVTVRLFNGTATGGAGNDTLTGVENVTGSHYSDSLLGSEGANMLSGETGSDFLNGLGGDDLLIGGIGNDVLLAGAGNDTLDGGLGNDTLDGGAGIDTAVYSSATSGVTVRLWNGTASGGAGVDTLTGIEDVVGSDFADTLLGADGVANTLSGKDGNDYINGLGGDDYLLGGSGNDTLLGGAGNDLLVGGFGNDTLEGGAGLDAFLFDTALGAANVDAILGFSVADDTIRLENAVFTGLAAGALSASAFTTGSSATTADHRIVYNSTTGQLFFDADGSGAGAAILFAMLDAGLGLTADDFLVV